MSRAVMIECPAGDLSDLAGVATVQVETKRMQGTFEIVELVATLSAAVTPLIAAFLTRPSRVLTEKRRVVIDGQRKVFENYDPDEVVKILEELNDD